MLPAFLFVHIDLFVELDKKIYLKTKIIVFHLKKISNNVRNLSLNTYQHIMLGKVNLEKIFPMTKIAFGLIGWNRELICWEWSAWKVRMGRLKAMDLI